MRANKLSGHKLIPRLCPERKLVIRLVRIPQFLNNLVILIQQRHAPIQIRHYHIALVLIKMARQTKTLNEIDMLPVQRKPLQPVIPTVRHHQNRIRCPHIHPDPMRFR